MVHPLIRPRLVQGKGSAPHDVSDFFTIQNGVIVRKTASTGKTVNIVAADLAIIGELEKEEKDIQGFFERVFYAAISSQPLCIVHLDKDVPILVLPAGHVLGDITRDAFVALTDTKLRLKSPEMKIVVDARVVHDRIVLYIVSVINSYGDPPKSLTDHMLAVAGVGIDEDAEESLIVFNAVNVGIIDRLMSTEDAIERLLRFDAVEKSLTFV